MRRPNPRRADARLGRRCVQSAGPGHALGRNVRACSAEAHSPSPRAGNRAQNCPGKIVPRSRRRRIIPCVRFGICHHPPALESRLARGRPSARNSARMARARRGALSKFYVVGRQPVEDAFDGPMWPVRVPGVPRGAKNEGSACYTTVLMQSLFALNMLRLVSVRRLQHLQRA
ncbi:hypothetical protein KFE25_006620 [Diacronema lutheri]|uniref:Uncharacterized protein n=2 Tax=Diacronema lutheri TaxID=2081491 RepID=A0A8J5XHQ2_DIALT|nr:hypothetical protein KFE25_006620 [Diacronema lutheri]